MDGDTKTCAQGILANFGNFEIIVSLIVLRNVLQSLREIITKLQKRDINIRSSYTSLTEVKNDIAAIRTDIDARFGLWYEDVLDLSKELGTDERVPRAKGTNNYRAKHPAESTMEYFKRSIGIPFVDDINSQLQERFAPSESIMTAIFKLIPAVIIQMDISGLPKLVEVIYRCTQMICHDLRAYAQN